MQLKFIAFVVFLGGFLSIAYGQNLFPVKVNQQWGFIDHTGKMVVSPQYQAISHFTNEGFAVAQAGTLLGVLNQSGKEIVPPIYKDIQILQFGLAAVRSVDAPQWQLLDLRQNKIVVYEQESFTPLTATLIAFRQNNLWGLVQKDGTVLSPAQWASCPILRGRIVEVKVGKKIGWLNFQGQVIVPAECQKIVQDAQTGLIFFQQKDLWGATDSTGFLHFSPQCAQYQIVSETIIRGYKGVQQFLYNTQHQRIISETAYQVIVPLATDYILAKKDGFTGIISQYGKPLLDFRYEEIQMAGPHTFRVRYQGKWGLLSASNILLLPFQYDYISPADQDWVVLHSQGKKGLAHTLGEIVLPCVYTSIQIKDGTVQASQQDNDLQIFSLSEEGCLSRDQDFSSFAIIQVGKKTVNSILDFNYRHLVMKSYEWFYDPIKEKYGLRKLGDGKEQIPPVFDVVRVFAEAGITLVGRHQARYSKFHQTNYRFSTVFGVVQNETGLLVGDLELWDVRMEDFHQGNALARVVFSNGKHGLMERNGKILIRDFAYIGAFVDGVAPCSVGGQLSGSLKEEDFSLGGLALYLESMQSASTMVDYTLHDQTFQSEAKLICESCKWGYLNVEGKMSVSPDYDFAQPFYNEVGIVVKDQKWGLIDSSNKVLVPFRYDNIGFLEQTEGRIMRLYRKSLKTGVIDTLGRMQVDIVYDEVQSFSEGRLAVKRNGLWGFTDKYGREIIPCRFNAVQAFKEGFSVVKSGNKYAFIDRLGTEVSDLEWTRLGNFSNGLAWAFDNGKYGYINVAGEWIIQPTFEKALDFGTSVAGVMKEGKFGLIDREGNWVDKPKYQQLSTFDSLGLAIVGAGSAPAKYGVINEQGKVLIPCQYQDIQPFSEGIAAVKKNDLYGFVSEKGQWVLPPTWEQVSRCKEGRIAVRKGKLWGFIDTKGQAITPFEYSKCKDFDGGIAVVYKNGRKAGLVDIQGQIVVAPNINRIDQFTEGKGLVKTADYTFYYIDANHITPTEVFQNAKPYQEGVAIVEKEGKWGVINQQGLSVAHAKYDAIGEFKNGFAKVSIGGWNGLATIDGTIVVNADYEIITYAGEGLFRVEHGDKVGYIGPNGDWIWGLQH